MPQNQNSHRTSRCWALILTLLLLLVFAVATSASAEDSESSSPPHITAADIEEGIREGGSPVYNAELTDPEAAEELPHSDLNREQALELMQSVFGPLLEAPAGVFDELHVERFLSDTAAILPAGEQLEAPGAVIGAPPADRYEGPTLIESTTPLRTEGDDGSAETVDLGLEHDAEGLYPSSPLVEVGIPGDLGEGISLPEAGVTISLEGAPEGRSPSTIDQSVASYPEVATDTSLAVSPTPTGVETMTILQSPEAPTSQTFHLDLPQGAKLKPTEAGGADVVKDGQPILGVAPPTALDAAEREVPVSLSVSGNSLTLQVEPEPGTTLPIIVDPLYETYNWWNGITGLGGWSGWTNAAPNYYRADHDTCTTNASPYSCQRGETENAPGLFIGALPGAVPAGSTANWEFAVPRLQEEWAKREHYPQSFIASMTLEHVGLWSRADRAPSPTLWMGIWNPITPGWVSGWPVGGNSPDVEGGGVFNFSSGLDEEHKQITEGKIATFNVSNPDGHNLSAFRDAFVNTATISIADTGIPDLTLAIGPKNWVNQVPSEPITETARDLGLGVYRLMVAAENVPQSSTWPVQTMPCTGTAINPCKGENTFTLTRHGEGAGEVRDYNPAQMPQGVDNVLLTAEDPLGNKSLTNAVKVWVDHTPPTLSLSGTATEQSKLGTKAASYTLKYSATDGDNATAAALAPFGTAGTGPGQIQDVRGIATDASGNVYLIDRLNERVMKYDSNGNFLMQFGGPGTGNGQFSDPRGITVSSNGTIWVSDEGNNNVQAFSPSGQFIRKIANEAGSNGLFQDPYGVAAGPGGVLWVSDVTAHELFEFNENGTFIRTATRIIGPKQKPAEMTTPSGLATDAAGDVWLSDWTADRVQEYSPEGEFIKQFSAVPGTASGNLETPIAIAVAPSGNLLVTEEQNNRVDVFQPTGTFLRSFGSAGSGNAGLSAPKAIAVGQGNKAYISDFGNHRVAVWSHADLDRQSGVISTEVKVDGQPVEPKYAPGCPTENCSISRELNLEADEYAAGAHEVTVTATDGVGLSTTQKLNVTLNPSPPSLALSGTLTEQKALGTTRPHYILQAEAAPHGEASVPPTFISAFGSTGSGPGQLNGPRGVAADGKGHVWVVDRANNRVEEFSEAGQYLSQFGSFGTANGQFDNPWGIAVTPAGNLWVADTGNERLQEFNSKGEFIQKFGTKAPAGSKGTELLEPEGIALAPGGMIWVADCSGNRVAEFREAVSGEAERFVRDAAGSAVSSPVGVAVDTSGDVWVAEETTDHLLEFDPEGSFIRSVGSTGSGDGQLNIPEGLGVGPSGDVYVADLGNDRVDVFGPSGEFLTKFGTEGTGNGNFSAPKAIAFGAEGAIFVTDRNNNRVHRWGPAWEGPPSFISAFGSSGSGNGQLSGPRGIAADGKGHVWVIDRLNERVEEFSEAGEYLGQFGSAGSGNGQFNEPWGIAVTPEGNLWVVDTENERLEEFNSKGEFIQKFGTKATGASKGTEFVQPEGIAVAPGGMIWVADNSGARIAEFRESVKSESERLVRNVATTGTGNPGLANPLGLAVDASGDLWASDETANHIIEYSAEGAFLKTFGSQGTADGQFESAKGIAIGPQGDLYVVDRGNSRVEVFNPSGEFLTKFGTEGAGNGNFSEPRAIAFGAEGAIFVADKGNNRVHKWEQPAPPDPIASIEVMVDGKALATSSSSCKGSPCSLARQLTLNSSEYLGSHSVTVKATSQGGFSTMKSLSVSEQRDEAKPTVEIGGELADAPEGWVEQKSYDFTATGSDPAGYGVTSLVFKLDGSSVASTTQSCAEGGCEAGLSKAISMAPYSGGSHEAEVVATDGAGNVTTRRWTINVDPEGEISTAEAIDTLEASDETAESTIVSPNTEVISQEEREDGNDPSLEEAPGGGFIVKGAPTETEIPANPSDPITVPTPEGSMQIDPIGNPEEGETDVANESALVTPNTSPTVDTVVRPIYDGFLDFANIRSSEAPEKYSWEVIMGKGQSLKEITDQVAEVYYPEDGTVAATIMAEPAHDATGKAVPTSLKVESANVVTLTVQHRVEGVVYPVVGGPSFEMGYATASAYIPPPPEEGGGGAGSGIGPESEELFVGAPEPIPSEEATISTAGGSRREYVKVVCGHTEFFSANESYVEACGNPFKGNPGFGVNWQLGMRGAFLYKPGSWAEQRGAIKCAQASYVVTNPEEVWYWNVKEASECHYGPRTSDGNGGEKVSAGHYLRAQAHWEVGHWANCGGSECPSPNPVQWEDKAQELHLWPSGLAERVVP